MPAFDPPEIADIAVPSDWVPVPIAGLPQGFRLERRAVPEREYRLGFKAEWQRIVDVEGALALAHQLDSESRNEGDPSSGAKALSPGMERYPFAAIWDLSAINFGLLLDLNATNPWGLFYDRGFRIRGFADDLSFLADFISTPEFRRSREVLTIEAPAFH
ncbi:hypothetical protein J2T08_004873 [Neorhizobium galegae]|uniref:hypothetical protein n=1 Tax=Neorhizobium galegae TaxID=399 RepID=UPI0027827BE7|nr:hypothetical protein [Neorhizobium galegae]MDQ0136934.1 hypothetical protein [Neorhizobium galegae]